MDLHKGNIVKTPHGLIKSFDKEIEGEVLLTIQCPDKERLEKSIDKAYNRYIERGHLEFLHDHKIPKEVQKANKLAQRPPQPKKKPKPLKKKEIDWEGSIKKVVYLYNEKQWSVVKIKEKSGLTYKVALECCKIARQRGLLNKRIPKELHPTEEHINKVIYLYNTRGWNLVRIKEQSGLGQRYAAKCYHIAREKGLLEIKHNGPKRGPYSIKKEWTLEQYMEIPENVEVYKLLLSGKSVVDIAKLLGTSESKIYKQQKFLREKGVISWKRKVEIRKQTKKEKWLAKPDNRKLVRLYNEGLLIRDIADELGITMTRMRARLKRARFLNIIGYRTYCKNNPKQLEFELEMLTMEDK